MDHRQAERDKLRDAAVQAHRAAEVERERAFETRQTDARGRERDLAEQHLAMLARNTQLTEEIALLTSELHRVICADADRGR